MKRIIVTKSMNITSIPVVNYLPQKCVFMTTERSFYENDLYDLLNDIDNQIDTFENIDITSTDLKTGSSPLLQRKSILKSIHGKNTLLLQPLLSSFSAEAVPR